MCEEAREPWYYWSRCKLGKDRVYWVVGELGEDASIAEGYCTMVEDAEQAARDAHPEARHGPSYFARHRHRGKVHEQRTARAKGPGGAEVRHFVYAHANCEYDGHEYWTAFPILKVTAKRIFIGRASHIVGSEDLLLEVPDPFQTSASLDRAKFERDGKIYHRKWREIFYRDLPEASRSAPSATIQEALSVLGLSWPVSPEHLRIAYRKRALESHPDTGGSNDEFRRLHKAYEIMCKVNGAVSLVPSR